MSSNGGKKRKKSDKDEPDVIKADGYESMSLNEIQRRIGELCHRVPKDEGLDPTDFKTVKAWASELQAIIEEFNLLVCCISAATYRWGSDRSGAADQNLGVLSAELGNSQEQIQSVVSPRLTNVLAPVVDLVVDKTITTKQEDGSEVKENVYIRKQVDPSFLELCAKILCRNATLLRQVCLANFHKIHTCIGDFLKAQVKDNQHDSRGFAY